MKHEWRKLEKSYYSPGANPSAIEIPAFTFFAVEGAGNPNGEAFMEVVEILYAAAYSARMMPKKGYTPEGYYEYTVYPLEGVWDLDEEGRKLERLDKDRLVYTLMIRQPDFVTEEIFERVKDAVAAKLGTESAGRLLYVREEEGFCVQCLHKGSYDSEPETFSRMESYAEANGWKRAEKTHREIYLSDARRVTEDKLLTVLRFKASTGM
ncbi:GyrI-like domain-containing protein [Cohnella sp. GCM10027633]|uniref:GyrI-like domain-containing protein n=1 Tax=unclassified Cohnella TaxID=2636738 RepID=UPI0036372F78